jgi:hypothetical protein
MLRIVTDMFFTAYALAVIRGALGDVPHGSLIVLVLGGWCCVQLRAAWQVQGLWR